MEYNNSVHLHYENGFVDPMYVPYQSIQRGNTKIYPFKKQGECAEPLLVREGIGLRFQRQYDHFPCPVRWKEAPNGFCVEDRPVDSYFYKTETPNFYAKSETPKNSTPHTLQNISFDKKTGERKEYLRGKKSDSNKIVSGKNYYC